MSRKEAPRAGLVKAALAGRITNAQGAQALDVSLAAVSATQGRAIGRRASGAWSIGCAGAPRRARGTSRSRERVCELVQTTYRDFNDCHATEKLREVEGLVVSRSTVRRLRRGPWRGREAPPPPSAAPRPPPPAGRQAAALVLIDGSAFDWLGTGTPLLLLGAIDDATGTVLALHFRPAEDLHGYLTLLRGLADARTACR